MIKTFDYLRTLELIEDDVIDAVRRVLHSGRLILGDETRAFEAEFAAFIGAKHCIGVHSGTSALHLALMALDIGQGDEVITVANTCTPTISAIELTGAHPVFVDVNATDLMIAPQCVEAALTDKTRCVIPVHLWGQAADMDALQAITRNAGVPIIEDCAQAHGTQYHGQQVGTIGIAGCFSFYPTKNLGAYGDAGAVVTNDDNLAERLRRMRMYGYTRANYAEDKGTNARICEMQAAILRVKLPYLEGWIRRRRAIAARYRERLRHPAIRLPYLYDDRTHAYHQYVIRCDDRASVIRALEQHDIGYGIHYETPIHQMPAYREACYHRHPLPVTEKASAEILSIPLHEALTDDEVDTVITVLNHVS